MTYWVRSELIVEESDAMRAALLLIGLRPAAAVVGRLLEEYKMFTTPFDEIPKDSDDLRSHLR